MKRVGLLFFIVRHWRIWELEEKNDLPFIRIFSPQQIQHPICIFFQPEIRDRIIRSPTHAYILNLVYSFWNTVFSTASWPRFSFPLFLHVTLTSNCCFINRKARNSCTNKKKRKDEMIELTLCSFHNFYCDITLGRLFFFFFFVQWHNPCVFMSLFFLHAHFISSLYAFILFFFLVLLSYTTYGSCIYFGHTRAFTRGSLAFQIFSNLLQFHRAHLFSPIYLWKKRPPCEMPMNVGISVSRENKKIIAKNRVAHAITIVNKRKHRTSGCLWISYGGYSNKKEDFFNAFTV